MDCVHRPQFDDQEIVRTWLSRAPILRRILARIGLPGKLIVAFLGLWVLGLAVRSGLLLYFGQIVSTGQHPPEFIQAMRRAEAAIILCNVIVALAALPILMVIVHRIFHPIRELVAATERIALGDLSARVAVHRPDAIGNLARAFNQMARRVARQQHELEAANRRLSEINRDLELMVDQRTAQLETANQRLKHEIDEKEDFLRAISHDLIAPLRNISGMASMLLHRKRDSFDNEVIHRLQRIQKNVEVENGLISELLEISKIKSGRRRIIEVDLNALIHDVNGTLEADIHQRGIRLVVDSPLPVLRADRSRMRQVFQNLIDNAIKYMGDGTIDSQTQNPIREIHIGAENHADEVIFYVRDTGMGIDPEDHEAIFHIFRRGRTAAVQDIAGKGVGLACVKSIIETYDGTIWVESEVGQGSTFRFTINGKYLVESRQLVGA